MEKSHSTCFRQLQGCLGEIGYELRIRYLSVTREHAWTPAINAYQYREQIVVCVELAGVEKQHIDLRIEPRKLVIRGVRQPLESAEEAGVPQQVLALEIDQGLFEREIALPRDVDPQAVNAEQRNGLLWIYLPFAP